MSPNRIKESGKTRVSAFMLAFAAALMGCGKEEGGATGLEDKAMLEGVLRLPDGKPAAGAKVRLYPVDHVPGPAGAAKVGASGDSAYEFRTDAEGRFSVDSLPAGEYNILSEKDGLVGLGDSVSLSPGGLAEFTGSLAVAGAVTARVEIQPHHDARTVTVQVLGTHVYSNVDEDGRFTLGGMAVGKYRLRIETGEKGYTTLFASLSVRSGTTDTLEPALRPDFTGVPVVTGLRVRLDTLAGVARLTWNGAKYRRLKHYVISRGPYGAFMPSRQPIGLTADTVWLDTLYPQRGGAGVGIPDQPQAVEYDVRVRNLSDDLGEIYGTAVLEAVPPSQVSTRITIDRVGTDDGQASLNDTVKVVAYFQNPGRDLVAVTWREDGVDDAVREKKLRPGTRAGTDTLFLPGQALGRRGGVFQIIDDAGKSWTARFDVAFIRDIPVADAGADSRGNQGDTARLEGKGTSRFGRIVKWEWDIGGGGSFIESPDGRLEVVLPDSMASLVCALRVTNEDGETDLDTVRLSTRMAWSRAGTVPFRGNHGQWVRFRGRIWHLGGVNGPGRTSSVHSSADMTTWRAEADSAGVANRINFAAFVIGDTLWVAGGEASDGSGRAREDLWWTADGKTWNSQAGHGMAYTYKAWAIQSGGKTEILPAGFYKTYTSLDGRSWTAVEHPGTAGCAITMVAKAGSLGVVTCQTAELRVRRGDGPWLRHGTSLFNLRTDMGWVERKDEILAFGGLVNESSTDAKSWATSDGVNWHPDSEFPRPLHRAPLGMVHDGRLWVLDEGELFRAR